MKTETKYKAVVYLSKEIKDSKSNSGLPVLFTTESESRDSVLNFVKKLYEQELIIAYRMMYLAGEGKTWYNDSDIVYLPENYKGKLFSTLS